MAPEADSGIFGNPEDRNKFMLTHRSVLQSTGDFAHPGSGGKTLWSLAGSSYVPAGCQGVKDWEQVKMGQVGGHLRILNQGMWHPMATGGGGCGVEILGVSPPPLKDQQASAPTTATVPPTPNFESKNTTALLRVISQTGGSSNTSYVRALLLNDGAGPLELVELGVSLLAASS